MKAISHIYQAIHHLGQAGLRAFDEMSPPSGLSQSELDEIETALEELGGLVTTVKRSVLGKEDREGMGQ